MSDIRHQPRQHKGDVSQRITLGIAAGLPGLIGALAMPLLVDGAAIGFVFAPIVILLLIVAVFVGRMASASVAVIGAIVVGAGAGAGGLPGFTVLGLGAFIFGITWVSYALSLGRWPALAALPGCVLLVGVLLLGLARLTEGTVVAAFIGAAILLLLALTGPWSRTTQQPSSLRASVVTVFAMVVLPVLIAVVSTQATGSLGTPASISLFGVEDAQTTVAGQPPDPFFTAARWQLDPLEQDRVLFTTTARANAPASPPIWASFPTYNGLSWINSPGFTVSGDALNDLEAPRDAAAETVPVSDSITVGVGLPGQWVPAPQRVSQVLGSVATRVDEFTGNVTSASSPADQSFVINYAMAAADQPTVNETTPLIIDEIDSSLVLPGALPPLLVEIGDEVRATAGPQTWQQLVALSRYFRSSNFTAASPEALADGTPDRSYAGLVDVVTTGTGLQEQYAALWALIARSWGVPTRLVIGWNVPAVTDDSAQVVVSGRATNVWAQARLTDLGWVTFQASPQDRDAQRPAVVRPLLPADIPTPTPTPTPTPDGEGEINGGESDADEAAGAALLWPIIIALLLIGFVVWVLGVAIYRRRQVASVWRGDSRQVASAATSYVRAICAEAGYELPGTWAPAPLPVQLDHVPGELAGHLDEFSVLAAPRLFGARAFEGSAEVLSPIVSSIDTTLLQLASPLLRVRRGLVPLRIAGVRRSGTVGVEEVNDSSGGVDRFVMK